MFEVLYIFLKHTEEVQKTSVQERYSDGACLSGVIDVWPFDVPAEADASGKRTLRSMIQALKNIISACVLGAQDFQGYQIFKPRAVVRGCGLSRQSPHQTLGFCGKN